MYLYFNYTATAVFMHLHKYLFLSIL